VPNGTRHVLGRGGFVCESKERGILVENLEANKSLRAPASPQPAARNPGEEQLHGERGVHPHKFVTVKDSNRKEMPPEKVKPSMCKGSAVLKKVSRRGMGNAFPGPD